MNQIEKFIEEIFADINGNEAKELKEEMKTHLIESVKDLMADGKTEQEAINIAINRFGDQRQLSRGIFSLFEMNNNFIKNLFRISVISLSFGLIILIGLLWVDHVSETKKQNIKQTQSEISRIINDEELSEQNKSKILSLVEETNEIVYFSLFKNPDPPTPPSGKELKATWEKVIELGQLSPQKTSDYSWIEEKDPYEKWYFEIGYEKNITLDKLYAIPFGLFIVFITLTVISILMKVNVNRKMLKLFLYNTTII